MHQRRSNLFLVVPYIILLTSANSATLDLIPMFHLPGYQSQSQRTKHDNQPCKLQCAKYLQIHYSAQHIWQPTLNLIELQCHTVYPLHELNNTESVSTISAFPSPFNTLHSYSHTIPRLPQPTFFQLAPFPFPFNTLHSYSHTLPPTSTHTSDFFFLAQNCCNWITWPTRANTQLTTSLFIIMNSARVRVIFRAIHNSSVPNTYSKIHIP
jgi:hypothetical protein